MRFQVFCPLSWAHESTGPFRPGGRLQLCFSNVLCSEAFSPYLLSDKVGSDPLGKDPIKKSFPPKRKTYMSLLVDSSINCKAVVKNLSGFQIFFHQPLMLKFLFRNMVMEKGINSPTTYEIPYLLKLLRIISKSDDGSQEVFIRLKRFSTVS